MQRLTRTEPKGAVSPFVRTTSKQGAVVPGPSRMEPDPWAHAEKEIVANIENVAIGNIMEVTRFIQISQSRINYS